jgi:hypothetical protein
MGRRVVPASRVEVVRARDARDAERHDQRHESEQSQTTETHRDSLVQLPPACGACLPGLRSDRGGVDRELR